MVDIAKLKIGDWVVPEDEDILCARVAAILPVGDVPGKPDSYRIELRDVIRRPDRGWILRSPSQLDLLKPGQAIPLEQGLAAVLDGIAGKGATA